MLTVNYGQFESCASLNATPNVFEATQAGSHHGSQTPAPNPKGEGSRFASQTEIADAGSHGERQDHDRMAKEYP